MSVYTCTLNLAIDLFIETDEMKPSQVNRTNDDDIQANGKGVNVSLIMKQLKQVLPGIILRIICIKKILALILLAYRE